MNDTTEENAPVAFDPLQFLGCVALNCLLALFLVGSPFAALFSHRMLPHPFSKLATILGIALSHIVFGLPVGLLALLLIVSFVTVDSAERGVPIHQVLFNSVLSSTVGAVAILFVSARVNGESIPAYWLALADWMSKQIVTHIESSPFSPEALSRVIQYQFPVSMVALVLLSVWLGVGLASHLAWFSDGHALSPRKLRDTTWGTWVVAGFGAAALSRFYLVNEKASLIGAGIEGVFAVLLFCQGCVAVSNILEHKGLNRFARSFWYLILSTVGFYFSVALGVAWLIVPVRTKFRRRMEHESHIA